MAKWIKSVLYDLGATLNVVKPWRSNNEATSQFRQVSKISPKRRTVLYMKRSPFERNSGEANSKEVRGTQQHSRCSLTNVGRSAWNSRQSYLPQSGRLSKKSSARLFRTSGKTNRKEEPWMMTDEEVMEIIREKERACKLQCGIVDRFETNKLSSNQPVEDRSFVAKLPYEDDAFVFGVLDGHGGEACAHSVSQRLADYISMTLLPEELLLTPMSAFPLHAEHLLMVNIPNQYNYRKDHRCCESLMRFYSELRKTESRAQTQQIALGYSAAISEEHVSHTGSALTKAFVGLDRDICQEALVNAEGSVDKNSFDAAVAGACAVVAYLNGTELYIANVGDCRAVMGVENDDGTWNAVPLSDDHTSANPAEVQRVLREHPDEASTLIRYDRLLGRLAPFRAFGDVRFKWDRETREQMCEYMERSPTPDPHEYITPPYLTAEPEVMSYQLQRSDKFLVLATDGLWDMLSNEEVVHFVQDHARKRRKKPIRDGAYEASFRSKIHGCSFDNAASCLIREALGGDDHVALSTSLCIPYPDVRMYRDDITVIVVHFDWDTLR